jgi:hypothetical protein
LRAVSIVSAASSLLVLVSVCTGPPGGGPRRRQGAAVTYQIDVADWSTNVRSPIPPPSEGHPDEGPPTGLAAGQGLVVVPAGRVLVAYGS